MDERTGDDELMQAAREGDEAAFAVLLKRHWTWVYRLMLAFVHDHDQAQDLAQETFCRLHGHLGSYTPQERFVPWLKRIAANVARNYLRGRRRARLSGPACLPLEDVEVAAPAQTDPAAVLSSHLLRDEVRAALAALSEDQRQVLVLHYFDGMDVQAIAQALACPAGTVKSRLFYGRRALREALRATTHRDS